MRSPNWWVRAVAPPAAAAAVIAGIAVGSRADANASPALPPKTSDQLLVMVRAGIGTPVHGDLRISSDLGFPALPSSIGGVSASGLLGLLSGQHRLRVWENGRGGVRAQILDQLDETDVVVGGGNVWAYTYSTNQATRYRAGDASSVAALLPDHAAATVLSQIGTSTRVGTGATTRIADRDAYTLVVEPASAATTIGRIDLDVDASTGVVLGFEVVARGASSAVLSVNYTSASFGEIASSVFAFTPPPAADVTANNAAPSAGDSPTSATEATIISSGWASIVVIPQAKPRQNKQLSSLADKMGERVQGGTLISTALVNALFTDSGLLLVGAVPAEALRTAMTNIAAGQ